MKNVKYEKYENYEIKKQEKYEIRIMGNTKNMKFEKYEEWTKNYLFRVLGVCVCVGM